jgi:prolipoprotein diacylglyceryl transferase
MSSTVPIAYIPPPPSNGFHIGPLFFHYYGLLIAIGVLAAFWLARRRWREAGHNPAEIEVPGIWAVVAGFIGGRIAYVSTHSGDFKGHWLDVVAIWKGGLALYGGLTLGILTGIYVARRRGLPVLSLLDAAIPGIPLAQAFGRWGNYFNQELFGTPSKLPWALRVDPQFRPAKYQSFATFHPTFLYESIWDLLVVGALVWLSARRKLRTGSVVLAYLGLYAVGRFLLELIRTDTTYRLLGLSRNAYVSLAVIIGAGVWLYLRERGRPQAAEVAVGAEGQAAEAAAGEGAVGEAAQGHAAEGEAAESPAPEGHAAQGHAAQGHAAEGEGVGAAEKAHRASEAGDATEEESESEAEAARDRTGAPTAGGGSAGAEHDHG